MFNNQFQNQYQNSNLGNIVNQQYTQRQPVQMTQPLSKDQIAALRNSGTEFSLKLTDDEILRSICTHKDGANFTLVEDQMMDGTLRCTICGARFRIGDLDSETIQSAVEIVKDALQNIKTYNIDMPVKAAQEFFPIIALLDKVAPFYRISQEKFRRYEGGSGINNVNQGFGFNAYNALTNPNMGYGAPMGYGMPMQQQQPMFGNQGGFPVQQQMYPQGGFPMQQQQMYGNPCLDTNYGYPQQNVQQNAQPMQQQQQHQQTVVSNQTVSQPGPRHDQHQGGQAGGQLQTTRVLEA